MRSWVVSCCFRVCWPLRFPAWIFSAVGLIMARMGGLTRAS